MVYSLPASSSLFTDKQIFLDFLHTFVQPVLPIVLHRCQGTRIHMVDVDSAVQMVNLMLQNARIPSAGDDDLLLAFFVQTLHTHAMRARNQRHESVKAQASLKKFDPL